MKTQTQHYYDAVRDAGIVNQNFLFLVQNGLTREDLARNIERRPALWSRFEDFLKTLPSREPA